MSVHQSVLDRNSADLLNIINHQHLNHREVDWQGIYNAAYHHRLIPVLNQQIEQRESFPIPEEWRGIIQKKAARITFYHFQLIREMVKLNDCFNKNKLKALHLKGLLLSQKLFGDLSLRSTSDIDLLVSLSDLEGAEELLKAIGYKEQVYFSRRLNDWKWRHHHSTFISEEGLKVELHWRLHPGPGKEPSFQALWEQREMIIIAGNAFFMPGSDHLFQFLIMHGARHGWSRLRWLYDIHMLVLKYGQAFSYRGGFVPEHVYGSALKLSKDIFNTEVPDEFSGLLTSEKSVSLADQTHIYLAHQINLHDGKLPDWIQDHHQHYLKQIMPIRQRVVTWLSHFYPYPEDVNVIPLPRLLTPLYFPGKPLTWFLRKTMKSQ
ncbi:nucleotidyltransferase domain-containing protein [Alkalicoccus luteus]|uniref:Nucleotidyltransferase family protein n=1 Tax=Alkalicoccus luteus TaxID=1237094 RepID=A0A969PR51_9BACI|nr:nucleotidyltransferase family protein [Alkalicoccus luteus]NJP38025.1 nucleotidyltransferase family protein [Alkalicoccus luteus]